MSQATFSVKVDKDLIERTKDAVVAFSGPPHSFTIRSFVEGAMKKQVASARRKGAIPKRPRGANAGLPGRPSREGVERPARGVLCVKINEELRDAWRDLAYTLRKERELAEFFETGLAGHLRWLEGKHGPIPKRAVNPRPGRRLQ